MAKKKELIPERQHGDLKTVARMLGMSHTAVRMAYSRGRGQTYTKVARALERLIAARKQLMNEQP